MNKFAEGKAEALQVFTLPKIVKNCYFPVWERDGKGREKEKRIEFDHYNGAWMKLRKHFSQLMNKPK